MTLDWVVSPARLAGAAGLVFAYAALCARVAWVARQKRIDIARDNDVPGNQAQGPAVLVVYASQTGQAEGIARESARMLRECGLRVTLLPIDGLNKAHLAGHERSLWIVSTTGEGDAPDHALRFVQQVLPTNADLRGHHAQVLALGDREYQQFCAFGEQIQQWLVAQGANSELLCVDNMDRATLQTWQSRVNALARECQGDAGESQPLPALREDWLLAPASRMFTLQARRLLNPGSEGGALYGLDWVAANGELPEWQSGDLVSLSVPADPEHARDYSIASIMADGYLQMLVRQSTREDGTPGVASGWLCTGVQIGEQCALTVRQHSSFRLGDNARRPLVLIGNGSGLAGLLSHIRARIEAGRGDQWLVYGERSPAQDAICGEQLEQWLRAGQIERLDRAWSRDGGRRTYVQDVLLAQADELRRWIERGATIYVCGSLQGMGQGVHAALKQVLGDECVQALTQSGRYRRDVY
ncbi:sulfite reductase subunit alpha [Diaphorobacter caeni]|uniref:sulfite reductase subunit alpha n=1 Tax=Diaphorobacter caeni TaxID=2784387 RepID=UPI00189036B6|nr:sulfite reductase subunit alpha [Diaphorobacter caeni]MBF5004281.1 flavodoxin domain-containing protein [Diaphorobacter caeni]